MDVFFGIIIQFCAEIIFQILCELPFEWIYFPKRRDQLGRPVKNDMYIFLFCVVLGLCMGAVSLVVIRQNLIYNEIIRFLNLFITPYMVGRIICWLHDRRTYMDDRSYLFDHFWNAYVFSFGVTMIRFIFL